MSSINKVINEYSKLERIIANMVLAAMVDARIKTDGGKIIYDNNTRQIIDQVLKGVKADGDAGLLAQADDITQAIGQAIEVDTEPMTRVDVRAQETAKTVIQEIKKHSTIAIRQALTFQPLFLKIKARIIQLVSKYGGISLQELRDSLQNMIVNKGLITGYYERWTYDTYNQYRRAGANEVRKTLGLKYAVYEGGEIETTRDFCEQRAGKVFSEEEILSWSELNWQGKPQEGYNPIVDLGGYNCRHRLRWISEGLALQLREDLKIEPPANEPQNTIDQELPAPNQNTYPDAEINTFNIRLTKPEIIQHISSAGVPDDFKKVIQVFSRANKDRIAVKVEDDGIEMERRLDNKAKIVYNDEFVISSNSTYKGKGFEIFAQQVLQAQKAGYKKIETYAAGKVVGKAYNGYYTWLRFGYKFKDAGQLKEVLAHIKTKTGLEFNNEHEMMATDLGRAAWKEHGYGFDGVFDLTPGSDSMNALKRYYNERKNR